MSTVPYAVRSSAWRRAGLCSQCGSAPLEGRKLCERHAEKSRRANAARAAAGLPRKPRNDEYVARRMAEAAERRAQEAADRYTRHVAAQAEHQRLVRTQRVVRLPTPPGLAVAVWSSWGVGL